MQRPTLQFCVDPRSCSLFRQGRYDHVIRAVVCSRLLLQLISWKLYEKEAKKVGRIFTPPCLYVLWHGREKIGAGGGSYKWDDSQQQSQCGVCRDGALLRRGGLWCRGDPYFVARVSAPHSAWRDFIGVSLPEQDLKNLHCSWVAWSCRRGRESS